jgi:hypothetical protein
MISDIGYSGGYSNSESPLHLYTNLFVANPINVKIKLYRVSTKKRTDFLDVL